MAMRTFDFSPLFRSSVGFDRLAQLMDSARDDVPSYPPYNIERTGEDQYRITMAVAGFGEDDIEITAQENALTVVGKQPKDEAPKNLLYRGIAGRRQNQEDVQYLHHGLAMRAFERRFNLDDYMEVKSASMEHGLLSLELAREVPEAMKPRTIQIGGGSQRKTIEGEKAA
jgi:molecular chaperone IbpA